MCMCAKVGVKLEYARQHDRIVVSQVVLQDEQMQPEHHVHSENMSLGPIQLAAQQLNCTVHQRQKCLGSV